MNREIRVLVIDDSAVVRKTMTEVLESDPEIRVIATAADPYIAVEKLKLEAPDVITLDVEMPRMDGLTFLRKLMAQHPIPVVMCSSLTERGLDSGIRALEYGAVGIITKPKLDVRGFLEESRIQICDEVKAAARTSPKRKTFAHDISQVEKKLTADAMLPATERISSIMTTEKIIVVGASTGGTEALYEFINALPMDTPGVAVVQHMPEKFTASFAKRLDERCAVSVKEAENNDGILPGRVLIAPGNKHMIVKRAGARYFVEIKDGPLVMRHRPSVDVLFRSASRYAGKNAVGVIMTGMGDDGAHGMLEMKTAGAHTIAQDEASCVVFGMPKEAISLGAVDVVLPLKRIAGYVIDKCRENDLGKTTGSHIGGIDENKSENFNR
jgi:two-component system chemotaxis response regulator CheB